ncbi:transcription factor TFIIE beta subunit, TFIIEB, Tfa2 [Savitreella phatthalungensis]
MSQLQKSLDKVRAQQRNAEVLPRFRVKHAREGGSGGLGGGVSSTASSPGYAGSVGGDDGPARKKLRPAQIVAMQQAAEAGGTGQHMLSQMQYSIEYLKKSLPGGKTTSELSSYLSKPITPALAHVLRHNERVSYESATDTYYFQPVYKVRNKEQLLAVLGAQIVSSGLSVKDLKEGWPSCVDELEEMEKQGEVLLIRQRKDDKPKTVWDSGAGKFHTSVDKEFQQSYERIQVPPPLQVTRELEALGLKATGSDGLGLGMKKMDAGQQKKQKRMRQRGHKVTNTHMQALKNLGLRT